MGAVDGQVRFNGSIRACVVFDIRFAFAGHCAHLFDGFDAVCALVERFGVARDEVAAAVVAVCTFVGAALSAAAALCAFVETHRRICGAISAARVRTYTRSHIQCAKYLLRCLPLVPVNRYVAHGGLHALWSNAEAYLPSAEFAGATPLKASRGCSDPQASVFAIGDALAGPFHLALVQLGRAHRALSTLRAAAAEQQIRTSEFVA